MLRLSDRRNFGRTFTGLALIIAPAVMVVATILSSPVDADDAAERFRQIADNELAFLLSNILWLIGALLLLGAAVGLLHLFRGPGVSFGQLAAGLLVVGGAAAVGGFVFGTIEYEMATREGVDQAALATFVDEAGEGASFIPFFVLFIAGVVLGLILLGLAAWRHGILPVWGGLLIVVAGALAFLAEGGLMSIVSFVVLLAGLGWLGIAVLGMSDEEWEAGPSPVPGPAGGVDRPA